MTRRKTLGALAAVTLALTLAACGTDDATAPGADETAPTTEETAEPSDPEETETPEVNEPIGDPAEDGADSTESGESGDDAAIINPDEMDLDVREMTGGYDRRLLNVATGRHDGFDRLVITFDEGDAAGIGWWAGYVDEATDDGSGFPVDVAGDHIFMLRLAGFRMPEETDEPVTSGSGGGEWNTQNPIRPGGTFAEIWYRGWFEGNLNFFFGIDGNPAPEVTMFTQENPSRLVIDFATN